MCGEEVGCQTLFGDTLIRVPFLLSVGDRVVVEEDATLETVQFIKNGSIYFDSITLESDVVVGTNSFVGLGSSIGRSSMVKPLTTVLECTKIPRDTVVTGVSHQTVNNESTLNSDSSSLLSSFGVNIWWHVFASLVISLPKIFWLAYYMSFILGILSVSQGQIYMYVIILLVGLPLINIFGQVVVSMLTIPIRLVLHGGKAQPFSTQIYSTKIYRHWISTKLYQTSISPTMGTIVSKYVISKLCGGNIDINSPFTIELEELDLISIGKNIFFDNNVKLRNTRFHTGGEFKFGVVNIGNNTMVLDRSVIEP